MRSCIANTSRPRRDSPARCRLLSLSLRLNHRCYHTQSVFEFIRQDVISVALLGAIDVFLALAGYLLLRFRFQIALRTCARALLFVVYMSGRAAADSHTLSLVCVESATTCAVAMDALSSSLLFCATLSILSPVLRTLTKSYADDTISVLASFLAFLHIVSHDYNYVNSGIGRYVRHRSSRFVCVRGLQFANSQLSRLAMDNAHVHVERSFSGTISLNAAIFTAVLLGSRLQSNEHVFAFILLAIEIFALFPIFQREVKARCSTCDRACTCLALRGRMSEQ